MQKDLTLLKRISLLKGTSWKFCNCRLGPYKTEQRFVCNNKTYFINAINPISCELSIYDVNDKNYPDIIIVGIEDLNEKEITFDVPLDK